MKNPEFRSLSCETSELRVERRGSERPLIRGYAARFDSWSQDLGGFIERIARGSFTRALREGADVRALVNHDPSLILGRTTAGTLRLFEDDIGLGFENNPPDGPIAEHYLQAIQRRDISGMSFRFYAVGQEWDDSVQPSRRTLTDVDIDDVSLATFPAYLDSSVAVRSLESYRRSHPRRTPRSNRAARLLRLAEADLR